MSPRRFMTVSRLLTYAPWCVCGLPKMVSVTDHFPVILQARINGGINNGHTNRTGLISKSDISDCDVCKTRKYEAIPVKPKPTSPLLKPNVRAGIDKDGTLMQWLMEQFEQNGLDKEIASVNDDNPVIQEHIRYSYDSDGYAGERDGGQSINFHKKDTSNKKELIDHFRSSEKTDEFQTFKEKTQGAHHYPRLPRSREASREAISPNKSVREPKLSLVAINQLFNEIEQKTKSMHTQNEQIDKQLKQASSIISNMMMIRSQQDVQTRITNGDEHGPHRLNPLWRLQSIKNDERFANMPHYMQHKEEDHGPTSPVTSPKWCNDSNYELLDTRRFRTPNSQQYLLRNQPNPNDGPNRKPFEPSRRNHEFQTLNPKFLTRRYSSANYSTELMNTSVSDVERERSEERIKTPLVGSPDSVKFPRPSWFGRTVSQVSLTDRQDKSKQEIPSGKSKYKEGFGGNQTAKGFSSFVLRPFVRKACTPGPCPVKSSSPIPSTLVTNDRCLSLMQLENRSVNSNPPDTESKERPLRFPKRPLPLSNGRTNFDDDLPKIMAENGYNLNRRSGVGHFVV
ncbi:hypothetical protein EG68_00124 [Paragonimus skrjabini miyazakii]|uniref:Uncharacterized protein n=1 Tax=Paragonimus skrjabini miyazakii TaxID=59628 RepID=A0A8S9ZAB7_9TREM|nr:hypothetical protein EG68_00124 [Paragonimus skrjabini miyazakii]